MIQPFYHLIIRLRKLRGLSQSVAADLLMIDRTGLSHIEHGHREPGLSLIIRMSTVYGVHPFELIIPLIPEEDARDNPYLSSYKKNSM